MKPSNEQLEFEIAAMLSEHADDMNRHAAPSPAVVARARSAVRHEINERWFAAQPHPRPCDDVRRAVRNAVGDALRAQAALPSRHTARSQRPAWSPGWAGLAAAAMIALCGLLIRQVGYVDAPHASPAEDAIVAATERQVEWFLDAATVAFNAYDASDEQAGTTGGDDLDASKSHANTAGGDVLNDLNQAFESVWESTDADDDTLGRTAPPQGVLG